MVQRELAELMLAMNISTTLVRALQPGDLAAAMELSTAAGWNQTIDDWRMLLDLAPDSCYGIEGEGQLVSTATLLRYRNRLAWIGMVLTKPEYRGRGYARKLVAHALDYADAQGIETVKLDATDQGQRLYESLGFREEQKIERWSLPGSSASPNPEQSMTISRCAELDLNAISVDRSLMLDRLAARSQVFIESNAYLFSRAGRVATYLGPCIASDPQGARALITKIVSASHEDGWAWDLLPKNGDAMVLASELGFSRQRLLTRMARGKPLRGRDEMVYAIAGFEMG
jgi:ribosomal protein S18 acetylase RimI-like enzyme